MPRIRSIKPDFFKSRAVRRLTDREKLVWIGLWVYADDSGRLVDEPGILVGELWALGLSEKQLTSVLDGLTAKERISRYFVGDDGFIQVLGWQHQKISHPTASDIPPAPLRNDSGMVQAALRGERIGEERKGGEPPLFCSDHPTGGAGSCGPCADARRAHAAWERAQKSKPSPTIRAAKPTDGHAHDWSEGYCLKCDIREDAA